MGYQIVSEVTITDPVLQQEKSVDSNGRVYLGDKYSGKRVKFIIEEVIED